MVLTNICMVSSLSVKLCLAGSWRTHRARDGAECLHPCEIFDHIPQGCTLGRRTIFYYRGESSLKWGRKW
jgi:hypothetical protein